MKLKIIDIAFHRNGICGAPFHVVLFDDRCNDGRRMMPSSSRPTPTVPFWTWPSSPPETSSSVQTRGAEMNTNGDCERPLTNNIGGRHDARAHDPRPGGTLPRRPPRLCRGRALHRPHRLSGRRHALVPPQWRRLSRCARNGGNALPSRDDPG